MISFNKKCREPEGIDGANGKVSKEMIKIKDLKKKYGNLEVLKGISTVIKEGEVISIIGPSGSGKSTFLRCINRLEEPTSGEIIINNKNILERGADINKIREEIGMVFQHFNLYPHKTVLENITLGPIRLKKISKPKAEQLAMELLEKVGLADKRDAYPNKLSGGQKQRVAIARALAMNPKIILFDEPTSALDPELVKEVLDIIRKLKEQKITMLIVSHEMNFVREISDRVVVMEKGKILETGTSQQIFENPSSQRVKEFLSTNS